MTMRATKFGANDAVYHYHSIANGEGFRFAALEGVAPIDLVGPEPRLVMIQRTHGDTVGKVYGPARNDAAYDTATQPQVSAVGKTYGPASNNDIALNFG